MANIVIERKVSLDFLGDKYKDAFLTFRALPIKKFREFQEKVDALDETDELGSLDLMIEVLAQNFIEGKFPEGESLTDVTKENIGDFDAGTVINCFKAYTGQLDPKA